MSTLQSDGIELRALRKQLSLTQRQAGLMIGVGGQTICLWEAGRRQMAPHALAFFRLLLSMPHEQRVLEIAKVIHVPGGSAPEHAQKPARHQSVGPSTAYVQLLARVDPSMSGESMSRQFAKEQAA